MDLRAVLLLLLALLFISCICDSVSAKKHKGRRNTKFYGPPPKARAKQLRHHKQGYTNTKNTEPVSHYKNPNKPTNTVPHQHQNVHTLPSQKVQTPTPVSERKTFAAALRSGQTCTQCPSEKVAFCGSPSQDLCDKSYESFVLALTWPSGFCKQIQSRGSNSCKVPTNKEVDFSIHGLWPQSKRTCSVRTEDRNGQMQTKTIPLPQYCRSDAPFVLPATNSQLYAKLTQYWVSYNDIGKNINESHDLWCHEWNAHGTCVEGWNSQTYLQQTVTVFESKLLRQKKSLVSQLSGVQPSNRPISISSLLTAFQNAFGVTPSLVCALDKQADVEYLREVVFCFDKQFNLKNASFCGQRSSCRRQEILFPL